MSTERRDRWAELDDPEAVASAARRLQQLSNAPAERAARQRFLDLLAPGAGEHALDVGAGTGEISLDLLRRLQPGGTVTALDPARGLLEIAARQARNAGLDQALQLDTGDARALPYSDGQFDLALCHWVLLHVANPAEVLQEMIRVVRPGGRVMCVEVDWATLTIHPGDPDVTRRIVEANVERQVDGRMGRQLAPLFRRAGLADVRVEPIVDVDADGDTDGWLALVESRLPIAVEAGAISHREAGQWWQEIEQAVRDREYFFSVTQFAVVGAVIS